MADQIIDIPEVGQVAFPDTMSDEQIKQVARNLHLKAMNRKDLSMEAIRGEDPYTTMWRGAKALGGGVVEGVKGLATAPFTIANDVMNEGLIPAGIKHGAQATAGVIQTAKDLVSGDPEKAGHAGGHLIVAAGLPVVAKGIVKAPDTMVKGGRSMQEYAAEMPNTSPVPASNATTAMARAVAKPVTRMTGSAIEYVGRKLGGDLPFHQRPLYSQEGELPRTNPMPEGRTGTAPNRTETPFHQRPLWQQMNELPSEGPMTDIGRSQTPPYQQPAPEVPQMRHAGPAPTLEQELNDALREVLNQRENPSTVSGTPEQTMTTTGKPSINMTDYDELLANAYAKTGKGMPLTPEEANAIVQELLARNPNSSLSKLAK